MKRFLFLFLFLLIFKPSINVTAIENQNFYLSCSATGTAEWTYDNRRSNELVIDEYKITVGKVDFTDRFPVSLELVNTNAERPEDFYLYREKIHTIQSYKDRVIKSRNNWYGTSYKSSYSVNISLISGKYIFSYRDEPFDGSSDNLFYSSVGKCDGLKPILTFLEGSSKKSKGNNSGIKKLLKKLY